MMNKIKRLDQNQLYKGRENINSATGQKIGLGIGGVGKSSLLTANSQCIGWF